MSNANQDFTQKLKTGIQRLSDAGNNSSLLGSALISIHGALEDYFRFKLSSNTNLSSSERASITDKQKTQWIQLLDLFEEYEYLTSSDRQRILRMNGLRQSFAHGEEFEGTRADVESYADFVQNIVQDSMMSTYSSEQSNVLSNNSLNLPCPCGYKCKGANRYGNLPQCYQSFAGKYAPSRFIKAGFTEKDGLGTKIFTGLMMGIFNSMAEPLYEAYECPACGCEVLFVSYNSSTSSHRKRVQDICNC